MRSNGTSQARTKKRPSSLPPNVEMDTHLKFSLSVTSLGFSVLREASRVSEKTQKMSSGRPFKSRSCTSTDSNGNDPSPLGYHEFPSTKPLCSTVEVGARARHRSRI